MLLNYHIGRFVLVSLCVADLMQLGLSSIRVAGFPTASNLQHTTKQEQNHQCGNSTA